MRRYLLTLDLKDNPEHIREYEYRHKPENIWPEIPEGIRAVGIREMEIYRWKNRLVIQIEAPDSFDLKKGLNDLGRLPKQKEWEELMDKFQKRIGDNKDKGKWKEMNKIFFLSLCK